MDSNNHKLIKVQNHNSNGDVKEEDRISGLPDSILHHILSFHETEIKFIARTSILSKRWNYIWRSIPSLHFPSWDCLTSLAEINKFMDFVDRTLLLHDASSDIRKVHLETNKHFNASKVHSWISYITSRNVKELDLCLKPDTPFFLPVSLFTCESLTKLELTAPPAVRFPKTLSFPKLQSLALYQVQFTDNDCWNEQHFSNCPVLESLTLLECTWFGMREFCIFTPKLTCLVIDHWDGEAGSLQDCDLKIVAPSLVYFAFWDSLAKDYDLSNFGKLDRAQVVFVEPERRNQQRIDYGSAVTKLFQAISHVKKLCISAEGLLVFLDADDFVNHLPTFHNLSELELSSRPVRDNLIFAYLKAAPNLESLKLDPGVFDDKDDVEDDDIIYDETEELFRHLQSVQFSHFSGEGRALRWVKLILKYAKSLQTIGGYCEEANKEVVMSGLSSLPRASARCVFEF